MNRYHVAEKFVSINGEAKKAGELAVFVRFTGCNLCCSYCDTKWANEKNAPFTEMSEEEIYNYIKSTGVLNVTLTGGEPLIQENMKHLLSFLTRDESISIEIETNGSVSIEEFMGISDRISFTVDYKTGASNMEDRMCMDNYRLVGKNDTVKFVCGSRQDLDKAREIIDTYNLLDRSTVYISSVFGSITPAEIVDYMVEYKLNRVRLQLQMHKYIWDPDRKGV